MYIDIFIIGHVRGGWLQIYESSHYFSIYIYIYIERERGVCVCVY